MSRFIIAHLQNGQYEGAQILHPETAQLMHSAQFHNIPQLNGMALGFYEETRNGHRIIGHGGDTEYFHSDLHLIPDAGVGFFVSYNSAGKGEVSSRTALWEGFLDRYFPYQPVDPPPTASESAKAQGVAGSYINTRRGDTTLFHVLSSIDQTKVTVNSDGTISIADFKDLNGQPKKFRQNAPMLYQEVDGQSQIGFKSDSGRLVMVAGEYPFMVFQKARWFENGGLNISVIVGAITIFALTLLLWPIGALIRRHYGRKLEQERGERLVRLLVRIVCFLNLAFLAGFVIFFSFALKDIGLLSPRYNGWLRLIQLFGWLGVLGTFVAIYNMIRSWGTPNRWLLSKIGDTAIALACLGFVWYSFAWNLLNLSLRY
jgi:hypothetical protein